MSTEAINAFDPEKGVFLDVIHQEVTLSLSYKRHRGIDGSRQYLWPQDEIQRVAAFFNEAHLEGKLENINPEKLDLILNALHQYDIEIIEKGNTPPALKAEVAMLKHKLFLSNNQLSNAEVNDLLQLSFEEKLSIEELLFITTMVASNTSPNLHILEMKNLLRGLGTEKRAQFLISLKEVLKISKNDQEKLALIKEVANLPLTHRLNGVLFIFLWMMHLPMKGDMVKMAQLILREFTKIPTEKHQGLIQSSPSLIGQSDNIVGRLKLLQAIVRKPSSNLSQILPFILPIENIWSKISIVEALTFVPPKTLESFNSFLRKYPLQIKPPDLVKILKELKDFPNGLSSQEMEVVVASLLTEDHKNVSHLIQTFIKHPKEYLPLIIDRPSLLKYMISHYEGEIQSAMDQLKLENLTADQRLGLIAFMKPVMISQLFNEINPHSALSKRVLYQNQLYDPLIALQTPAPLESEARKLFLLNLSENFLTQMPNDTLGMIAKTKPNLLLPLIPFMDDLRLAIVLPLLTPQEVLKIALTTPSLIRRSYMIKRAPLEVKKNILKACIFYPESYDQLISSAKKLLERLKKGEKSPEGRFQIQVAKASLESKKGELSYLRQAFKTNDVDELLLEDVSKKEAEAEAVFKELSLLMQEIDAFTEESLPEEFYDALTGEIMKEPIRLPGISEPTYVDRSTLLNKNYFEVVELDGNLKRLNPYTKTFFDDADYVLDSDLQKRIETM